jgi:tol-pal system protein YbgF
MRRGERHAAARVLWTVAAVLAVAGCATKGDMRNVQVELRALAARQDSLMSELRRETRSTQDTVRQQANQLFDFRGDLSSMLRSMNESLTRLEAIAGENQRGIAGMRDQLANLRRGSMGAPPADAGVQSGGAPGGEESGGDPRAMFDAGVNQFNRGSLTSARQAFESFLQAYPTQDLAPDAHYYLADILYQQNRLQEALDAFNQIPQLFPTAGKVPDALYRMGTIQNELGNTSEARATLERVVNTYPDSDAATLAADKLREIGR